MNRAPMRTASLPQWSEEHKTDVSEFSDWQARDAMPISSLEAEQELRQVQGGVKKSRDPFCGSLPFATTPKVHKNPDFRMVPATTRSKTIHTDFAKMSEARGPLYQQQWPVFDNVPFLPSRGDVALDPRYGVQTKGFSTAYMKLT